MTNVELQSLANNIPLTVSPEWIKKTAASLPKSARIKKVTKRGKEIIQQGFYSQEELAGIDKNEKYTCEFMFNINSEQELFAAFKKNGKAGLQNWFRAFYKNHVALMERRQEIPQKKTIIGSLGTRRRKRKK